MKRTVLGQPHGPVPLGNHLKKQLDADWIEFRAAIAFVKRAGVEHLADELGRFAARGSVRMSVGVNLRGTSREGLQALLDVLAAGSGSEVWVFHNTDHRRPTFHPKVYLFKKPGAAFLIVGSGNLTQGGLFTNYEVGVVLELNLDNKADLEVLQQAEEILDTWCDPNRLAKRLTPELLAKLVEQGMVPDEAQARGDETAPQENSGVEDKVRAAGIFGREAIPAPPALSRRLARATPAALPIVADADQESLGARPANQRGFLMTLQRTDVGVGQTTAGTSRRSPEIFIPLAARNEDPDFWGWPQSFHPDPSKPGKMDRMHVRMRIGGEVVEVNMMTWPDKHDFRLRAEALRSAGKEGDILRIERVPQNGGFEYYVEIVPQGTTEYARRLAQCVRRVRNSQKRYGYY